MHYCIISFVAVAIGLYLWLDNRVAAPGETPDQKSSRLFRRNIGIALLIGGAVYWAWMHFGTKQKSTFDRGDPYRDYFTARDVYNWRQEDEDIDPSLRSLLEEVGNQPEEADFMRQRIQQRRQQARRGALRRPPTEYRSPARRMAQQ